MSDKIKRTIEMADFHDPTVLFVVETDRNRYMGIAVPVDKEHFQVMTGFAGRPAILRYDEVEELYFASQHQDLEVTG